MHLGMSGSFRINRDSKRRTSTAEVTGELHDHVVFTLSNGVTVTFNDPRRFGVMDLLGRWPCLPPGVRGDGAGAPGGVLRRRGTGAGADWQARRTESGAARSACRRRSRATSMRAKRCIWPACRRCGDRRCWRQRQDARPRAPSAWRRRSRPSCERRSPAKNARIAPAASASTSTRVSPAERPAAMGRSAESRRPADRRFTVRRVSADRSWLEGCVWTSWRVGAPPKGGKITITSEGSS